MRAKHQSHLKKLQEKQQLLDAEAWVQSSKQFQVLQSKLQYQEQEKEKVQNQLSEMEREMVYIRHLDNQHKLKIEECERVKQEIIRLKEVQKKMDDDYRLERQHEQEVLGNVRSLKTQVGDERTLAHWKLMFQALEVQQQTIDYKTKQIQDQHSREQGAIKGNNEVQGYCERMKVENERLKVRAKDREARITQEWVETRKAEDKVFEMDFFVTSITNFKDSNDGFKQSSKEDSEIQEKVRTIEKRLQGSDKNKRWRELQEQECWLQGELHQAQQQCDGCQLEVFRLKKQQLNLQQQLQQSEGECSYYLNEIEITGKGYENMVTENKEIQKYMEAKDEEISQLILEKQRVNLEKEQVSTEVKQLLTNMVQTQQDKSQLQEQHDKDLQALQEQQQEYVQKQQQVFDLQQQLWQERTQYSTQQQSLETISALVEGVESQKDSRNQHIEEIQETIESDKQKRASTEEQNMNLKRALLGDYEVPGANRSASDVFRQLKCSVCHSRQKSTILVRCLHTFCRECINRCLETRQRRCPKCKTGFTNNEVKPFSLD
eukprot:TRINITY_DN25368_c0_g1_i4.p1 TRINITY_DN25368_c0_g1~~TRINITY_DN25368_c0_g1_i4.p1  ORF type:complete len:547 (-),score=70.99 TRINITY_DN25368_c0_g1_i4:309-1949(-)